ncbi:MAG: Rrf2 family transcriptional regulator [Candidatus Omnitrophica bacterium]|nr:Rrf2 family transcriptional regulator [Candidatus Omnitrophota bacterium]
MKLITRDTDYAVRALCYIAGHKKEKVCVSAIVKELKIPRPFLRKIFQALNKKGILKSYKGKGGGFELAQPPENIFLIDLIEVFQGPLKINECMFKNNVCPSIALCPLNKKITEIEKDVSAQLSGISIYSLVKKGGFIYGKKKNNKN